VSILPTSPLFTEQPSIQNAYLEQDTTIVVKLTAPLTLPFNASDVIVTDTSAGKSIPVLNVDQPQASSAVSFVNGSQPSTELEKGSLIAPAAILTDLIEVSLAQAPDVTHSLHIALKGYTPAYITPRNVLNAEKYMYRGNDLGNTYQPEATAFRLWAPTASDVQILLYDSETGPLKRQVAMLRSDNGTWNAQVSGDLQNW